MFNLIGAGVVMIIGIVGLYQTIQIAYFAHYIAGLKKSDIISIVIQSAFFIFLIYWGGGFFYEHLQWTK